MDGVLLGTGNFGRVELASHILTNVKVRFTTHSYVTNTYYVMV